MAIQPAVCTSCGGKINVDDINLNGYGECIFCHVHYKVIDVITVDGLPTVKSLLESASLSMEDSNYEKAVKLFNEVINIKPNCHEAWWGLYLCNSYFDSFYQYKDKYGNGGPITKATIMMETLEKYASRAIDYAPEDIANGYRLRIDESMQFIEAVRRGDYDTKVQGKSGCYIATAIYGSYSCEEVLVLRKFRDEQLSNSRVGKCIIKFYYRLSPTLANYIKQDSTMGIIIRKALDCLVTRVYTR